MNLGEIDDEVAALLGNRSEITAARRYLWINNAQRELAYAFPYFQNADKKSSSMVIGQAEYQLPLDCIAIYSVRDVTLKRKITRTSFRKLDNIDALQSGNPTHYIRFGSFLELTPVPSVANSMLLRFGKAIATLSNRSDSLTLPDPWHECVLLGAEVRGWRALRELAHMAIVKNEYLQLLRSREPEWEQEEGDEEWGVEVVR